MKLVFATHNPHKLQEIKALLPGSILLSGLFEAGLADEIPETGQTLKENALIKAQFVAEKFKVNCFADDSGLEVEALNGEPGVYSARYAGPKKIDANNVDKLLKSMEGKTNRKARFKTVIALILDAETHLFTGEVHGKITHMPKGSNGFGYDPVFIPEGCNSTFAEMAAEEKNRLSHRARAVEKLVAFLGNKK